MRDQQEIHDKNFKFTTQTYKNTINAGNKKLVDAIVDLNALNNDKKNTTAKFLNKKEVLAALYKKDANALRDISNAFYNISGIYSRVCNYFACLYRYDWYVVAEVKDKSFNRDKMVKDYTAILQYLDNSYLRKMCADIALAAIKDGVYYGYILPTSDRLTIQDLPIKYCRSRYCVNGNPVVEFNMRFFDSFGNREYGQRILKLFPDDFKKGYIAFKTNKLIDETGRPTSWYTLNPDNTFKFAASPDELPLFVNAVPSILDLEAAQDLDRRKQMQKLLKIIVQQLPLDKNGDLLFDIDEAQDLHENAVEMLRNAIGCDVLTTFTDVKAIDMSDKNTATSVDDLSKVERALFNNLGISQNLLNTDGNLSLEKSILNDESYVRTLLLQFNIFFDRVVSQIVGTNKKYYFKFYMLETTQYNYKELSKMYKEQMQLGCSKLLPQIALGHSQSFIINTINFENDVLRLSEVMIPPLSSNTMSGDDLWDVASKRGGKGTTSESANNASANTEKNKGGRPEKPESEKTDKTLANEAAKD